MSYALNTIANAFIRKAQQEGRGDLTPMKLLKLVYIAHGWSLGLNNKPLFLEEVEAWKYGPVIRELYHSVKHYKNRPIEHPLPEPTETAIDSKDQALLDRVWEVYGSKDGITLSSITHRDGSPWSETWDDRGLHGLIIPTPKIRDHYRGMVKQATAHAQAEAQAQANATVQKAAAGA